nr:amino acid permease [Ardenticatena sp.]
MSQPNNHHVKVTLSRDLGLLDITMIGVGAMIGAGIFVLTGIAAGHAGPGLLLAFFLNGIIAMIIGSAYAELGSCFPEAGGGYLWVKQGMSDMFGFLSGWMSWFAHAVACSLYALGFGSFAAELYKIWFGTPPVEQHLFAVGTGVAVAALFTFINFRGASETGLVGNIVTSIKIFILLLLVGFGLVKIFGNPASFEHYTPFLPEGWLGVFVAMGLTFIAFEGYEIIAQSGEEVKDPAHNIPRAIFLSIVIAVAIYLLVAFVVLGAIEPPPGTPIYKYLGQLGELGMAEAAGQIMPYGKVVLLLAGLASTMSALNATIYSSSRVSFAMGRDGNLPEIFGRIHPITHTPHWAVFISGALIIGMAIALPIEDVAASADIMFLLLFMMVCYSLITLRERRPDLDRQFMVPFFPYLPWLGIVLCLLLSLTLFELSPIAWYTTLGWIFAGVLIYFGYGVRQRERRAAEEHPILLEEVVAVKEYSVMVPVSDLGQADRLGELGAILAKVHDGELFALHVVRVPRALTISEGRVLLKERRHVLDLAIAKGKQYDVPVRTMIRLGRRIGDTILQTARERKANLMLLGWPGYTRSRDVAFGSVIDLISKDPPCDLAVVRFRGAWQPPKRIVVPLRGAGVNARLALSIARDLQTFYADPAHGGHEVVVQPLHLRLPSTDARETQQFHQMVERLAAELGVRVAATEFEAESVVDGIVEASHEADVIIMGASEHGLFEQRLFGNIPEQVMRRSPRTVIMCKAHHGQVAGFVRRLLTPEPIDLTDPDLHGLKKENA